MHAMSARKGSPARVSLPVSKLQRAVAAVIEPLECRALLSAGTVLGTAFTDFSKNSDTGGAVVRVDDQKLLQVGLSYDAKFTPVFSLARFTADGKPDEKFGPDGSNLMVNYLPDSAYSIGAVNAVTVDPTTGRIIVVGRADRIDTFSADFLIAAFTPEGKLDESFGSGGVTISDFNTGKVNVARAVSIDEKGRILVAGMDSPTGPDVFAIARYSSDGKLDESFGIKGVAETSFILREGGKSSLDRMHAMAVDAKGNIILAGSTQDAFNDEKAPAILIERYTDAGVLDDSFGKGGFVRIDIAAPVATVFGDKAYSVAVDTAGGILIAGSTDGSGKAFDDFFLLRLNSDGSSDTSFGEKGLTRTSFGEFTSGLVTDIAIQRDGAIVVAGGVQTCGDQFCGTFSFTSFAVGRYHQSGAIDPAFGNGTGIMRDQKLDGLPEDHLATLALQSDADNNQMAALGSWMMRDSDDLAVIRFDLTGGSVDLTGPAFANEGETVHFKATLSGGITGGTSFLQQQHRAEAGTVVSTIISYNWSIALDGAAVPVASGFGTASDTINIPFTPADNGLYHVFISINDGADTDSLNISVANVAPTATINGAPPAGLEGSTITLGSTVTDPGAGDTVFSYAWSVRKAGLLTSFAGTDSTFTFTPDDNGSYEITLTVTDDDLGVGAASTKIEVANVDPIATIEGGPNSSPEGTAINLTSTVTDPGAADTFTYAWSLTKNGTAYASGTDATFAFTPDDNGDYLLTLTVTDDDGGVDTDLKTITVTNVPPTAAIKGAPGSSPEGTAINFTSTVTDPGQADTHTYAWSVTKSGNAFDAGSEASFTLIPDDDGIYEVILTVTDDDGGVDTDLRTITVTNVAPTVAVSGAPESSPEGTEISLTSTVSDPGLADTFTYSWSVTRNDNAYASSTAADFSFTPDDNGTYIVSLSVTDDDGDVGSDIRTIAIDNVAPTAAIISAPASADEGSAINLSSAVGDPGSADTHTYAWSVTKDGSAYAAGAEANFSFTATDNGEYVVILTVTDDDGGAGSTSKTILINNVAPTATINAAPASASEGSTINLSSAVSDPGADTFTYAWSVSKNGSAYATGTAETFSFTPDDNGSYIVTLTVTDDDGGVGSDSRTILINNVAPVVAAISGPANAEQGVSQTFTSSFSDPGSADSWTVTWNFGDGTTVTTAGAPGVISTSHTYLAAGAYTVSVTVSDDDGGSATQTSSITIASTSTSTLQINGSAGADDISVKPYWFGILIVNVNGVSSLHSGITHIVINGGAGNDRIKVSPYLTQPAVVFAGDGDDSVKTGSGNDIIVGGNGDDLMHGNDGRDILIGGWGEDRIVGNADSDILVASYSLHDSNASALNALLAEWTSGRSYGQRTANVTGHDVVVGGIKYFFGGPRNNGSIFLATDGPNATVFDDGEVDLLTGSAGLDLFLFNGDAAVPDMITGLTAYEFAADIDFLYDGESGSASCSTGGASTAS
jgi:uncharacterized delta-60 repeat protein